MKNTGQRPGKVTMQWQLNNAWPTKITSTDLKSDGNEVAVDTLELAHKGMVVKMDNIVNREHLSLTYTTSNYLV